MYCTSSDKGLSRELTRWAKQVTCTIGALGSILAGCNTQVASHESLAVTAQAVTQASVQSFELPFFTGTDVSNMALLATETLRVADRVKIVESSNNSVYAPVENTGAGSTEIGSTAEIGSLTSTAIVWLRSNATVNGDLRSAGTIDLQLGAHATGITESLVNLGELRKYRVSVRFPAAATSIALEPDQTAPIAPGTGYESIVLKSRAYISMSAGQYYTDRLQVEPDATLQVDTRNGPVVVWVKNELNYKGKVSLTGPDGAFMIGYLGTNQTSLERAISATVIAPNATLRLAPIGSPGWFGSFFAKSIDAAEAGSTITHRPFDYWTQLLEVKPILHCVRRFGTTGAALFGYENLSDVPASLPIGPNNQLVPATSVQPPTDFQPGLRPRQFWAPFDLASGMAWSLSGNQVTVSAGTPACRLGDATPGDVTSPSTDDQRIVDVPGPLPTHLEAIKLPDQHTEAMSGVVAAPAPTRYVNPVLLPSGSSTSTGGVAVAVQPLGSGSTELVNYTFKITDYKFNESEGLCGQIDPYAKITLNGTNYGNVWEATTQIPKDQQKVSVHVEIWDDDDFPCGDDDFVESLDLELDTYLDESGQPPSFLGIYWSATPIRQPKWCMDWSAQFLDSGPWTNAVGTVGSEDFGATKNLQKIPASYAAAALTLSNNSTPDPEKPLFHWEGVLDRDGCVSEDAMPPRAAWKLGTGLRVKTELYSGNCLDPNSNNCANDTGVLVLSVYPDPANPGKGLVRHLCQVLAEDPASVSTADCSASKIGWTTLPGWPYRTNYRTPQFSVVPEYIGVPHDSTTRAAAAVSQILKREVDSNNGLGVTLAMATRRYQGTGALVISTQDYCNANGRLTSCQQGNILHLEPAGLRTEDITRFKYAIVHEFGHYVARAGMGTFDSDYGDGAGVSGVDPMCQCAHLPVDEQGHCLQSLERPSAAQTEGFAQFFSAKVWNKDLDSDCTFVHGKHFLNTTCMPGVGNCVANPNGPGIVNQYPIPVSCRTPVKWRNNHCVNANSTPDLLAHGIEYDWLEFYYAINNNPVADERWSMSDIFHAYIKTCGDIIPGVTLGCNWEYISWVGAPAIPSTGPTDPGTPEHKSLTEGVKAAFGENSFKAQAFLRNGRDSGVSNEL